MSDSKILASAQHNPLKINLTSQPQFICMKIRPGYIQSLPYYDATERGFLLGDDDQQVFITKHEVPKDFNEGQSIEVFVFYNEGKEMEATTQLPEIQIGQVGCFRVRGTNDIGAFVNIGTRRDILVPKREQLEPLETDRMALVILCDDPENQRLFATTKLNRMMKKTIPPYKRGDEVQLMIAEKIEVGRRVVIDGQYLGALFRQEMTDRVRLGEKVKGYVRKVEGKDIVVSMQREGMDLLEDAKVKIIAYLEMNGGYARLNDDTDPEEIKLRLHISKKTFKKAAGMLFKEGKVLLTKFGVKINKTGEVPAEWSGKRSWVDEDDMPEKKKSKHHNYDDEEEESLTVKPRSSQKSTRSSETFSDRQRHHDKGNGAKDSHKHDKGFDRDRKSERGEHTGANRNYKSQSTDSEKKYRKPQSFKTSEDGRHDENRPSQKPKKTLTFKGKK